MHIYENIKLLVNTIAALVESLTVKVKAWELEKGMPFLYNKVHQLYVYFI